MKVVVMRGKVLYFAMVTRTTHVPVVDGVTSDVRTIRHFPDVTLYVRAPRDTLDTNLVNAAVDFTFIAFARIVMPISVRDN